MDRKSKANALLSPQQEEHCRQDSGAESTSSLCDSQATTEDCMQQHI